MSSSPPRPGQPPQTFQRVTTESEVRRELESAAGLIGQALDSGQVRQVALHLDLITAWNRKAHLTSITEAAQAARVHVVDSLLCFRARLPAGPGPPCVCRCSRG